MVAILCPRDEHHQACVEQLHELRPPLRTCWPVVTEAAYLLRGDAAALSVLLKSFEEGVFEIAPLDAAALPPIAAILHRYANLKLQLADAALLHLAERDGIQNIFTLDRRDFGAVRLKGGKRLHLLPAR